MGGGEVTPNPMDIMNGATNMAATGVGLGIMTMGAMLPLKIMGKMADNMGETKMPTVKVKQPKMPKIKKGKNAIFRKSKAKKVKTSRKVKDCGCGN
jgi:hypothetical protein